MFMLDEPPDRKNVSVLVGESHLRHAWEGINGVFFCMGGTSNSDFPAIGVLALYDVNV